MHLLLFVPEPGFAHLPMQFAALSSQRGPSVTAFAGELESAPIAMSVIAKKRCRAMSNLLRKVSGPRCILATRRG
jgi:hypothetical protein